MSSVPLWVVRGAAGAMALAGAAGAAFGAVLVVDDQSSHTDDWDGFGTFLGLLVAGPGLVLVAVATLVWWLSRRDLRSAAMVLCGLGVVVAGLGVLLAAGTGAIVSGTVTVVGLAMAGAGLAAASVDSPGGSAR
jgi:hypothetical protein